MSEPLPETTLNGEPARAWCHLCETVQAFKSLDELQEHMKQKHGAWGGTRGR